MQTRQMLSGRLSVYRNVIGHIGCLIFFAVSCSNSDAVNESPDVEESKTVRALWDLETHEFPLPSDLERDHESGRLNVATHAEMSGAEIEYRSYLNGLDGYPLTSRLKIPLSGQVKSENLPGTVILADLATGEPVFIEPVFDVESMSIVASPGVDPAAAWLPGRTYGVGLWGYEGGVQGESGKPVVADAAFQWVRGDADIIDNVEKMPGKTLADRQQMALKLADLQESYKPLFEMMRSRGVAREQIAVVSSFTTTNKPAVWFDLSTHRIPMPNDLLLDLRTGRVALPASFAGDGLREGFSYYDGFSSTGAIVIRSTHRIGGDAALQAESFRVFRRIADGGWVEERDVVRGVLDDGYRVWLKPRLAFEPGTQYAFVVTSALQSEDGEDNQAQPTAALLRSQATLVGTDGKSEVSELNDAEAARLEPFREIIGELLADPASRGVSRAEIAAVVPFRTTSAASLMMEKRAQLYTQNVRTDVVNISVTKPSGALRLLLNNVDTIVRGELTVLDHLDPKTHAVEPGRAPEERLVNFSLTLPKQVGASKSVPVVLFGHGLMTSRELVYLIADELAQAGYAALAIDLPLHGERSICRLDSDCERDAHCGALNQCLFADGSRAKFSRFEIPHLVPFLRGTQYEELLSYPITSGAYFLDFENLFATRDRFGQAVLDLMQALRVLRGPEISDVTMKHAGMTIDGNDVMYLGMSLGGIVGASLSAVEPTLNHFVLNVPAADLMRLIEYSDIFKNTMTEALAQRGIRRGTDAYFEFSNMVRWILDPVDPINMVQHSVLDPIRYIDPIDGLEKRAPVKRVMLQMVDGDAVVPNEGTRALSERMGVPIKSYYPGILNHAFLFDPNPLASSTRAARQDMLDFYKVR